MANDWANDRLLRFMLALVEQESFRLASELLHTSLSNVSDTAQTFLEDSGLHLYYLDRRKQVHLTRTGIAFREMVRPLFEARDEVMTALEAIEQGKIRSLRLGCGTFVDPGAFRVACEIHKQYLPDCQIHPFFEDAAQLVSEVIAGDLDAALVTLPVESKELQIQEIRRDRLVVCLRADDPLARSASLRPAELTGRPAVLYHPRLHPAAHARLLEMLAEKGLQIEERSRVSHPTEIQQLIVEGYGLSLIREGTALHPGLITRPITGVTWTVDTAFIYHGEHHPKTMPVLARDLRKQFSVQAKKPPVRAAIAASNEVAKRAPQPEKRMPEQLTLPGLTVQ